MQKSLKARPAARPQSSQGRGMSLTTRLSLLTGVLVALVVGLLTFVSIRTVQNNQNQTVRTSFSQRASTLADLTGRSLEVHINALRTLALDSSLINLAKQQNSSYTGSSAEILNKLQKLDAQWRAGSNPLMGQTLSKNTPAGMVLSQFLRTFPEQSGVLVTDKYGATLAATHRLPDYYQADQGWWQAAWSSGAGVLYIGKPKYEGSANLTGVEIALPLRDPLSNTAVGVIRSVLNIEELRQIMRTAVLGDTGRAEIYASDGKELLSIRSGKTGKLPSSVTSQITSSIPSFFIGEGERGQPVAFAHAPVRVNDNSIGWNIVFRQDTSEAFAASAQVARDGLLLGLIALVVATLLALLAANSISAPIRRLAALSRRVGQGDLSQTANIKSRDEIGLLAGSFNEAIVRLRGMIQTEQERDEERRQREQLQSNVSEFLNVAMDIAGGDFTRRGRVTEDVLGNVVDAINLMVEELSLLLKEVQTTASQVGSGSLQMEEVSTSIFKRTQQQAQAIERVRQQTEQVARTIQHLAAQANTSAQAAQQTLVASAKGQEALTDTLAGMQSIRREVQNIAKSIKGLSDRSMEISEVVETIDAIAKQTNLLALNASLEAAGAGEAGARFGVVARQVRKLAEDTAKSAQRVSNLVKGIQTEVQGVSLSVEGGSKEVEQGYRIASEASERLREISTLANQTTDLAKLMAQMAQQQAGEVVSVGQSVQDIALVSEETQMQSQYGRQAAGELSLLAKQLRGSLQRFRLPE